MRQAPPRMLLALQAAAGSDDPASHPGALPLPAIPQGFEFQSGPGSEHSMPGDPLVPDPYEQRLVYVAPSGL